MDTEVTTNNATTQDKTTASTPTQTGAANPGSTEAKFTQADLEREIAARIERAADREKRVKAELLKQLGLAEDADFNTLKSTIDKAREIETANLSAVEKAEKAAADALRRAEAAEQRALTIEAERRNDRIETELRAALATAKANNPKTVLSYILVNHKEAMQALLTEDGKIDEKAMAALVETVKKEDVTLFTPPVQVPGSMPNNGARLGADQKVPDTEIQRWKRGIRM